MFALVGILAWNHGTKLWLLIILQELQSPIDSDQYLEGKRGK